MFVRYIKANVSWRWLLKKIILFYIFQLSNRDRESHTHIFQHFKLSPDNQVTNIIHFCHFIQKRIFLYYRLFPHKCHSTTTTPKPHSHSHPLSYFTNFLRLLNCHFPHQCHLTYWCHLTYKRLRRIFAYWMSFVGVKRSKRQKKTNKIMTPAGQKQKGKIFVCKAVSRGNNKYNWNCALEFKNSGISLVSLNFNRVFF